MKSVELLAHCQGKGEGCDYTIGCNQAFIDAYGETLQIAQAQLVEQIKDECGYQDDLESVEVYVFTHSFKLDMTLLKDKKTTVVIEKMNDEWIFIFEDGRTEDIEGTHGLSSSKAIRLAEQIAKNEDYEIVESLMIQQ